MRFTKTEAGQQALRERSPLLSARQRTAFILFDGQRTVEQVLATTAGTGLAQADVDHLVECGFLAPTEPAVAAVAPDAPPTLSPQERYLAAKPVATRLVAALGLRGFRLNLAVESAAGFQELQALLPKIQGAVGTQTCEELEHILKG